MCFVLCISKMGGYFQQECHQRSRYSPPRSHTSLKSAPLITKAVCIVSFCRPKNTQLPVVDSRWQQAHLKEWEADNIVGERLIPGLIDS